MIYLACISFFITINLPIRIYPLSNPAPNLSNQVGFILYSPICQYNFAHQLNSHRRMKKRK